VNPKEAPDSTVTATDPATDRAREVVTAYKVLSAEDGLPDDRKHLWSLANSMIADIHRGRDNYPVDLQDQ
jgi:hypothetical protein